MKDPVCGMEMQRDEAEGGSAQFQEQTYYFCSDDCRKSFEDEPSRYVAPH